MRRILLEIYLRDNAFAWYVKNRIYIMSSWCLHDVTIVKLFFILMFPVFFDIGFRLRTTRGISRESFPTSEQHLRLTAFITNEWTRGIEMRINQLQRLINLS